MILPPSTAATVIMVMISMPGVPGALFSINGRGANQWNHWVKINGQVYALWYNGQFGEDNLYLLRPFSTTSQTPAVTVRYRYTLNSIRSPGERPAADPQPERRR
ncbi:Uncharacterised protein [Klebsiella pneumoniae]|uniref:Uncharacterized protein n=1 Tax=Klebsiella pneumoniae TaxID=573 RepID=A0A2X3FKQ9_KLEPN|nr:Uncharacterised protein [Klebsiella pneumoniae]